MLRSFYMKDKMTKDDIEEIRFWKAILVIVLTSIAITLIFALTVNSCRIVQQPMALTDNACGTTDEWQDISRPRHYVATALYDVTHELRGIRIQLDRLNSNIEKLTDKTE